MSQIVSYSKSIIEEETGLAGKYLLTAMSNRKKWKEDFVNVSPNGWIKSSQVVSDDSPWESQIVSLLHRISILWNSETSLSFCYKGLNTRYCVKNFIGTGKTFLKFDPLRWLKIIQISCIPLAKLYTTFVRWKILLGKEISPLIFLAPLRFHLLAKNGKPLT